MNAIMNMTVKPSPSCAVAGVSFPARSPAAVSSRSSSFNARQSFSSGVSQQRNERAALQVVAGKSKGKGRMRTGGGGGAMMPGAPPTPAVDPANAEFVLFVRATKLRLGTQWVPLSVVKGGQAANVLVQSLQTAWGLKLFGNTLIRNIGQVVYKDRAVIERQVRRNIPALAEVTDFEFGFKIRDKNVPEEWYRANDITVIPSMKELPMGPLENIQKFIASASK